MYNRQKNNKYIMIDLPNIIIGIMKSIIKPILNFLILYVFYKLIQFFRFLICGSGVQIPPEPLLICGFC
jgi:hypothetical protein